MNFYAQMFLFACGLLFFIIILVLLLKNRISEKPSILWLGGGFCIFIISGFPNILDHLAKWIGISYPPSLLFFLSTLVLLGLHLYHSIEITKLNRKIAQLTQYIALANAEIEGREKQNEVEYQERKEVTSD
ncbi:MAG: DUF2304 domain-containing protein [Tuberibacillus sp.]